MLGVKAIIAKCKVCGNTKGLVHDINGTLAYRCQLGPSVCFDCWRTGGWKELKRDYLESLAAVFLFMLPLLTGLMWLIYVLWWRRHDPHWDTPGGFALFLCLPAILAVGTIPQISCQLWLTSRYGPKLELMGGLSRFFMDMAPMALWALTSILAFFGFVYLREGRIPIEW